MRILVCAIALSVASITAFAADAPQPNSKMREACKADVETLCKGIERGKGKIAACLKEHEDKVSAGCKAAIAERMKERQSQGGSSSGSTTTPPPAN